jgi:pimeloyl-ACP methyl ester carboxylesterase
MPRSIRKVVSSAAICMAFLYAAAAVAADPVSKGYAPSAEGLQVYYSIYGKGDPIVVMAGGFGDATSMMQTIEPLSRKRQVIAIELEGHGHTALRASPMSHEKNGDDVAAVLRHLKIPKADIAGYSHGADAALRMAIQHPEMVRNLIVISTATGSDGWYPDNLKAMRSMTSAQAEQMKQTPMYKQWWAPFAPHPEQWPTLLDRMGDLMRKDYDWRPEIAKLQMPTLLLFCDHDAVPTKHIAEFFALFGGGLKDAGWQQPKYARARLAIVPGYTHYNFGMGPDMARVIEAYLEKPTTTATQFTP